MKFKTPLISGELLRRYKRFLADVKLANGETITAHTANTGSMKGLTNPGNQVYLSFHDLAHRKLKYSWEIVRVGRVLVGINTHHPNRLVEEGIRDGVITELQGYGEIRREVPYGEKSRIDLLLANGDRDKCFVEVKNVTLVEGGRALFPDAVTGRGLKHLLELRNMVRQGHRSVLVFVLQRADGQSVGPANAIDPAYGQALREVSQEGVEILAYRAKVTPKQIRLLSRVPLNLSGN